MNILDLMKGRVVLVNTDMKVEVELIIQEVVENTSSWSRETEPATIEWCPGYIGYLPENLDHEVCKWCGCISYYH